MDTPSPWGELLQSYMTRRGFTRYALAKELGLSTSIVTKWFQGAKPSPRNARLVAQKTGLPLAQVLEAAELSLPGASDHARYPEWVTELLDQLTPGEIAVVAQTATGLLRLREDQPTPYEAASPAPTPRAPRPPKAPRRSSPE
ncbi:MAG: helix-turn-helix domain-containing protein [Pseudomonadales bacterium]